MCAMPQCLRRYLRQPSSRTPRRTQAFLRPRSPCQRPFSIQHPQQQQPFTPPPALSLPPALTPTLAPVPSLLAPGSGSRPACLSSVDLLGSARGKWSVWDWLLSGAGAALSAVQDAYGTVCDVRARDAGNGGSGSLLGELQDWSAPPSVDAASTLTMLSRFEPPCVTKAV